MPRRIQQLRHEPPGTSETGLHLEDESIAQRSRITRVDRNTVSGKTRRFIQEGVLGLVDRRTTTDCGFFSQVERQADHEARVARHGFTRQVITVTLDRNPARDVYSQPGGPHVVFNRTEGLGERRKTGAPVTKLAVRDGECCMIDVAHSGQTSADAWHDSDTDVRPHSLSLHRIAIAISILCNGIQPHGCGEKSLPLRAGFCPDSDAMQPAKCRKRRHYCLKVT